MPHAKTAVLIGITGGVGTITLNQRVRFETLSAHHLPESCSAGAALIVVARRRCVASSRRRADRPATPFGV